MKTTNKQETPVIEIKAGRAARHTRLATRDEARTTPKGSADRQVAEIERTFTLRYEW